MSTIEKTPVDASRGQTHAFIVGVNSYAHLPGGSKYDQKPAKFTLGLNQLTSPVISAIAFRDWLFGQYNNPDAPLSTIEILLSDTDPHLDVLGAPIDSATFANVRAAFDLWESRCDQHSDNVALFYFCGHGLDYATMTLLTEDFGASKNLPWENAIDFNQTFYGMNDCRAQVQCYFIDACRESPREVLQFQGFDPSALKTSQAQRLLPRAAPVLKACAQGTRAFAEIGQVSYFTQELLRNFKGLGAGKKVGDFWRVTPESLTAGIGTGLMRKNYPFSNDGGVGQIYDRLLHLALDPVPVMLNVWCDQPSEYSVDEVRLTKLPPPSPPYLIRDQLPVNGKITHEVKSGIYHVETAFIPTDHQWSDQMVMIYPPEQDIKLA